MRRKLVSLLGLLVSITIFSFSAYSLVTKRYQHTIVSRTPVETQFVEEVGEDNFDEELESVKGVVEVRDEEIDTEKAGSFTESVKPAPKAVEGDVGESPEGTADQVSGDSEVSKEEDLSAELTSVSMTIDYGDGRVDNFDSEVAGGTSVYDFLTSVAVVEAANYSFGAFVESINGVGSDSDDGWYWLYEINGKKPNVGADQYKLSDGDEVRWVYTKV